MLNAAEKFKIAKVVVKISPKSAYFLSLRPLTRMSVSVTNCKHLHPLEQSTFVGNSVAYKL